jgi:diguanylate cyclase (GGDEF)-like protein
MDRDTERSTILVIDDTPANLSLISITLSSLYELKFATSAEIGLKILEQCTPDLILLDIIMPGIDGYEMLKILKEREDTRDKPVIFITARKSNSDEEYGLRLGAVDYISKPFTPAILKLRISNQLLFVKQRKMLEDLINIDYLTQIPNRRKFDEVFIREWRRCQRSRSPLTLLMIDVDNFKLYNDHHGHAPGDEVLKSVADAIRQKSKRSSDFPARWGGEEFALLLSECDREHGLMMAQRVCNAVEELAIAHSCSPTAPVVTISVGGVTAIPDMEMTSRQEMLTLADAGLYRAKEQGRNRVVWSELPEKDAGETADPAG